MSYVTPHRSSDAPLSEKLSFRRAKSDELSNLKMLYESAWGSDIRITTGQLFRQIVNFPEGQLVGCLRGSDIPLTMINIMPSLFNPEKGFQGGYDLVTGGKTFSTHVPLDVIRREARKGLIGVALCVSVAVLPECASHGFAVETLNHAIAFAESCGLAAVPYSAPRGFAKARAGNPRLDIIDYLHLTLPPAHSFDEHIARISRLNLSQNRICRAFSGVIPAPHREMFEYYRQLGPDEANMPAETYAFRKFLKQDALVFGMMQDRQMTVEDFCILTGRRLLDPVMRLHVENGARYIRNDDGELSAVFADSRPEDRSSLGYNVLLSYDYNPLLVGFDLRMDSISIY
ncbi:MAG: hypothetical protein V1861_05030 [Candidatus Micrarchaeota archaeon]